MGVKQRYQEADYLDVGTEAEKYAFMGTGFTKIDDSQPHRQLANAMLIISLQQNQLGPTTGQHLLKWT